ncbi:aryl hydrocarbon receptor-like isoform X2 [Lissotriton helveticus]
MSWRAREDHQVHCQMWQYKGFTKAVALKTSSSKVDAEDICRHGNQKAWGLADGIMPEGELLLQALNGFVLVVTAEGLIFYSSHTIQEYLGFNQTDVIHQSVFELIHTEDQQEFRRNLHWALNPPQSPEMSHSPEGVSSSAVVTYKPDQLPPENSAFLERSFVCRFRCLLDNSSGFLALNLQGRLKFLHGQNQRTEDGSVMPPQPALFAISTPLQSPSILEIRTKNMIFRTKHQLDFTPLACDAKGKVVLGYTEAELRMRGTGYQFIHAADMLYCAENHVRMMKTGESGLTVFRLLTKENHWKWVQANARLVYKNGKPDYIIATQRPLVEEEGGDHLRKRSMHLPFTFATGEALLYQTSYPIPGFPDPFQSKRKSKVKKNNSSQGSRTHRDCVDPNSLLGAMMRQDKSVYVSLPATNLKHSFSNNLSNRLRDQGWQSTSVDSSSVDQATENGLNIEQSGLGQEDPLLCTLGSLSIDNDDSCSNDDLFKALENLGLDAEDLELLLLDERMMRVEADPECAPSLNDLLSNNEILSYVHDSLINRQEQENNGDQEVYPPVNHIQTSNRLEQKNPIQYLSQSPDRVQPQLVLQISQQMKEYSRVQKQKNGISWDRMGHTSPSPQLLVPNTSYDQPAQHIQCQLWRQQVEETGGPFLHQQPASSNGQPEVFQSMRSSRMDLSASKHNLSSVILCQDNHGYNQHLTQDRSQSTRASFQYSQRSLPNQCQVKSLRDESNPWGELQHKNSQNILNNGLSNHSSVNLTFLESNPLPNDYLAEHTEGLPSWTDVSGHTQGLSLPPQLSTAQTSNSGMSTVHFYLNGFSNTEIVDSVGTQDGTHQFTGFGPPAYPLISDKQSILVPPAVHCSLQKSSLDHFMNGASELEIPLSSCGMYSSVVMENHVCKVGNGCVVTGPLPEFPGLGLLPNGNSAVSSEESACPEEEIPLHSNLHSNVFYL